MLEKKYYDGMQIHDVLCECLDDYDTILTILEKFASLPSAIIADRKTEPQMWTCPKCGTENHIDYKKCPCCGYDRKTEPQSEKCPFDDPIPCEWVCPNSKTDCEWYTFQDEQEYNARHGKE